MSGEMNTLFDNHSTFLRVVVLLAIFLSGYVEAVFFKLKDLACVTWFMGLAALTAWIVYPLATVRIFIGVVVFVTGMIFIILYYRKTKSDKE